MGIMLKLVCIKIDADGGPVVIEGALDALDQDAGLANGHFPQHDDLDDGWHGIVWYYLLSDLCFKWTD